VPLTSRLADALRQGRHLKSARVLCDGDGHPLTQKMVQGLMRKVAKRAHVQKGVHILRHHADNRIMPMAGSAGALRQLVGHKARVVSAA